MTDQTEIKTASRAGLSRRAVLAGSAAGSAAITMPGVLRAQAPVLVAQQHSHQQPMRTGTDNMPVLTQSVHVGNSVPGSAAAGHGHHSLGGLNNDFAGSQVPSVWRHGRTAAAKVEALSQNGMDEIEIPAFLRKQAD